MKRREVSLTDLRRLHYGELSAVEDNRLRQIVEQDATLARRLASIAQEEAAFVSEANVAAASADILSRLEATETAPQRRGLRWMALATLATAASAAAVVVAINLPLKMDAPPTTRTKGGGPSLEMYVKDEAGVHLGRDGVRLRQGDRIQFRYHAFGKRHLMVVSVDSRGIVSALYPDQPGPSIEVEPRGVHVLQGSVILDDTRGPEHIVALFSDAPLNYTEVKEAADRAMSSVGDITALPALRLERDDVQEKRVLIVKE